MSHSTKQEDSIASLREEYEENEMLSFKRIQEGEMPVIPSSDGTKIFTVSGEDLCAIQAEDGTVLHSLKVFTQDAAGMESTITTTSFALSPIVYDSSILGRRSATEEFEQVNLICTATSDGFIRLHAYKSTGFSLVREWVGIKRTTARLIAFSPAGEQFATCCADGSAKVWDVQTASVVSTIPPRPGRLTSVHFIHMGCDEGSNASQRFIAFGSETGELSVWSTTEDKVLQRFNDSKHALLSIEFIQFARKLLVVSADQTVFCYNCQHQGDSSSSLILSVHDKFLVKEPISTGCFIQHRIDQNSDCETTEPNQADLKVIASKEENDVIAIIAFASGNISAYSLANFLGPRVAGNPKRIEKVAALSADDMSNHTACTIRFCDSNGTIWCAMNNDMIYALEVPSLSVKTCFVSNIDAAFSIHNVPFEASKALLIANNTPTPILIRPGSSHCLAQLTGHSDTVLSVATAFDGRLIATGSRDRTIRLWVYNTANAKSKNLSSFFRCIATTSCPEEINGIAFLSYSSRTKMAIVNISTDDSLNVWKIQVEKKRKRKVEESSPLLSHDSLMQTLLNGTISLQKAINHTINGIHAKAQQVPSKKATQRAGGNAFALSTSPSEKYIATGGRDKTVSIYAWSPTNGLSHESKLTGHKKSVYCVLFNPFDSGYLASGSGDCTMKLWSLYSGTCEQTFQGHTSAVVAIDFITEGLQVVSADTTGTMRIWRVNSGVCVATLTSDEDEKIWALNAINGGQRIFTGASNGTIRCWDDVTEERSQERAKVRSERQQNNIRLEECMHTKDYAEGVRRALELKHPRFAYNFLRIFVAESLRVKGVDETDTNEADAPKDLKELIESLSDAAVETLLRFCADWVRIASRSSMAQRCINAVFCSRAPEFFHSAESEQNENSTDKGLIKTMHRFTMKYATRVQNMLQEMYSMEYFEFLNSGSSETLLKVD